MTFVRSEEDDPLGLVPFNISLYDHLLWGLSYHFLLLECILVSKWGLRPNIKVQVFAPYSNKEVIIFIKKKKIIENLGTMNYPKVLFTT